MQVGKEGKRVWQQWVSRMGKPISEGDLREARSFFEELYLYGKQGKQLPSNIKAGVPLTSDERMAYDAGFKDRTRGTMMGETDRKRDILRRCMREAGYGVQPEMAPEKEINKSGGTGQEASGGVGMGQFKTECPACGGGLSVVRLSWVGRMPLEEDGFSFIDADPGSATDDEVVKCDKCGKEFSLGDLMNV